MPGTKVYATCIVQLCNYIVVRCGASAQYVKNMSTIHYVTRQKQTRYRIINYDISWFMVTVIHAFSRITASNKNVQEIIRLYSNLL